MLVAYCRLCRHCRSLAEGGCLLSRFHFTHCRYFLGHVACWNLPWQGLTDLVLLGDLVSPQDLAKVLKLKLNYYKTPDITLKASFHKA